MSNTDTLENWVCKHVGRIPTAYWLASARDPELAQKILVAIAEKAGVVVPAELLKP